MDFNILYVSKHTKNRKFELGAGPGMVIKSVLIYEYMVLSNALLKSSNTNIFSILQRCAPVSIASANWKYTPGRS